MSENKKEQKNFSNWAKASIAVFGVICLGLGFFAGFSFSVKEYVEEDTGKSEISKVLKLYQRSRSEDVSFDHFWAIWNKVKKNYVEEDISDVDLFYGAIEGMVAGLGDEHSIYFPPKNAEDFIENLEREFSGIGAEIGFEEGRLMIVAPLKGSPAEKAGLKAGDFVVKINGEDSYGLNLEEAVMKIRGEEGTAVVLTIFREGADDFEEISITRANIKVPTVELEMRENDIAYVRLSYFNDNTAGEFSDIVGELLLENPKAVVLDLRLNPGGYLDAAVSVASEWVDPDSVVVRERFRNGKKKDYLSKGPHRLLDMPTVVLMDQGTASGSEIVAGALRDHGKAKLLGKKSFGKGSVQSFELLPVDGSALKLTIAEWLTPNESKINKIGIEPDILVEEMMSLDEETGEITDHGYEEAERLIMNDEL